MENKPSDQRAWQVLEKVVNSSLDEQRRARRWSIFFKLLTFAYLFIALALFLPRSGDLTLGGTAPHTAMVRVEGMIADREVASADNIVLGLRRGFEDKHATAVLLAINSPGGSPVQAGQVYDEIKRLRGKYPDKKVYAVISDLGASGAYYIAAGADLIYADQASLVGSIGVVSASFGFTGLMQKLGVERRLFTAGENKGMLDPFSPLPDEQQQLWQTILDTTHQQFIARVKAGRGKRLVEDPLLFTGMVWSGEQALQLGLIDGLGSLGSVARDVIGAETIVDVSVGESPVKSLLKNFGMSFGAGFARQLEQMGVELK
ncbi:MAG TPA: S49 family peptidase [Spongiibacteraceae bacterium]|nr:S49 family peptidase [Spongiibacteraceae bacterium]